MPEINILLSNNDQFVVLYPQMFFIVYCFFFVLGNVFMMPCLATSFTTGFTTGYNVIHYKSSQNPIVLTIFRLISVRFIKIPKKFLCVFRCTIRWRYPSYNFIILFSDIVFLTIDEWCGFICFLLN